MQHYKNAYKALENLEYTTTKTNKKIEYLNLSAGFDIETTSTTHQNDKVAFMYIWAVSVGYEQPVFYGRTWPEFLTFCEQLQNILHLNESRRLIIYVHNLGYEFQFMRHYFEWVNVFSLAERKPIKALTTLGIEFKCSYILSGFSLANTAKNLVRNEVEKMVGDLDYDLIRTHQTQLSPSELKYVENDVLIITAYIDEQIQYHSDITKIPLTNTGRVRSYVGHECYHTDTNHKKSSKGKYYRYRKIMGDLTLEPSKYVQMKRAFMGGFTHANANHTNKTLADVSSIDFTSSYPAVMIGERFPMSRFNSIEVKSTTHFNELVTKYALIFDVKFINLKPKITQENYISESKCFKLSNPVLNNGRVYSADLLATTLTEVDYAIMEQCYTWDSIELANVNFAHKGYLPKSIIKSILDLYQGKTELKDVAGYETEYLLSKGMLNSIYGMSVTDIVKDNALYFEEWETEKVDLEEEIENYNKSKNRFLYYPWGLWVTAYARKNLWTGILAVGDDYVYSDTDSLKLLNYEKHTDYIKWFDNQIIEKMHRVLKNHNLNKNLLSPKTKHGITKTIGVWDFEGTYKLFKTLGAKRYLTLEGDKLALTVAGLSKQNGIDYLIGQAGGIKENVFNLFNDNLYVPAEKTGKMTHTYLDNPQKFIMVDYKGESATIETESGVHLEKCEFTLSLSTNYLKFMNQLSKGYLYRGVKHE